MTRTSPALSALLLLLPLFTTACGDKDAACNGDVEISCDEDGTCICESGPNEGDECIDDGDLESEDPESCEVMCCDESGLGWF